jgi:hypothetical protein
MCGWGRHYKDSALKDRANKIWGKSHPDYRFLNKIWGKSHPDYRFLMLEQRGYLGFTARTTWVLYVVEVLCSGARLL